MASRTRYWGDARCIGDLGRVKPSSSKALAGKQVRYLGRMGRCDWVKLLEAAPGHNVGDTFMYKLHWVDWTITRK